MPVIPRSNRPVVGILCWYLIALVLPRCSHAFSPSVLLDSFSGRDMVIDPCFSDKHKRPTSCVPDFVNAAFGVKVETAAMCGTHLGKYCTKAADGVRQKCHECQAQDREAAEFLTDLHNPNNETCWLSDMSPGENVTLTVSLKKKFELTYISLHFCSHKPKSMAIYKSMDHGKSWQPFQYYSDDCLGTFQKSAHVAITRANEQEALCVRTHMDEDSGTRIAFSTLADRPSAEDFEHSPVLQDWVTATDIRIVFPHTPLPATPRSLETRSLEQSYFLNNISQAPSLKPNPWADPDHLKEWIGISDLAIGGRCKCNGHASDCKIDPATGDMTCHCKHNTDGKECEKCKEFHFDRPWGRATSMSTNECVPCQCNNHARRCRFNMELYQLSGGVSGGVCLKCRHNTAGRHCHYCKEGYFRNPKKAISHKRACEACNCHPVGASGKICNQTNGQCPCKDGVTGRECNRCARGYQQSGSPIAPCIKVPNTIRSLSGRSRHSKSDTERPGSASSHYQGDRYSAASHNPAADDECAVAADECRSTSKRIQMRKYCSMDSVYLITVLEQEHADDKWTTFRVHVDKRYKKSSRGPRLHRGQETTLWVKTRNLRCRCPRIEENASFLIFDEFEDGNHHRDEGGKHSARPGFVVSKKTLMIEWKREWRRRMKRFKRRSKKVC
eukprot:maker-scaffold993_size72668-snap-gene-0.17 protein:Tk11417 transcript:maker-scaffold993_size72668-snap-gene-0.17-mRNA-1 annotation:"Netrin-3"